MNQKQVRGKKRNYAPNSYVGYGDDGHVMEYYWQKEPFIVKNTGITIKISWAKKYNPIWQIHQRWLIRKYGLEKFPWERTPKTRPDNKV